MNATAGAQVGACDGWSSLHLYRAPSRFKLRREFEYGVRVRVVGPTAVEVTAAGVTAAMHDLDGCAYGDAVGLVVVKPAGATAAALVAANL